MSKVTLHSVMRALIQRDGRRCQICRLPIYFNAPFQPSKNGKVQSHPCAPTVDHITPVSHGGPRGDLDNLRLAHKLCNQSRNARAAPSPEHVRKVARLLKETGFSGPGFKLP